MSLPSPALVSTPQIPEKKGENGEEKLVFDPSYMSYQTEIPSQFIWPESEKPTLALPELQVPQIDLNAFFSGDPEVVSSICAKVNEACKKHGFFHLVNHGVDNELLAKAHGFMDDFFCMTLAEKERAHRKVGEPCGYASSFVGRFTTNLPWKETLSFRFIDGHPSKIVEDYIVGVMGEDFKEFGSFYQNYCEVMSNLALKIAEILGVSSGVGSFFREFYEQNDSMMRLNYYPPCQKPDLALGTGPHFDPTSLTILHEDQVGGLQVFVDGQWYAVTPKHDAFVINIGDTFMALTNGVYKSCMHRAVVNSTSVRKSLAFFLNPNAERVVSPPMELIDAEKPRICPDFTWPALHEFTQKHHRADTNTLVAFSKFLQQNKETN